MYQIFIMYQVVLMYQYSVYFKWLYIKCIAISHTEAGSDYVAVIEEQLVFSPGDSRVCHMIGIFQDEECELVDENESFFSDLSIVGDMLDITVDPATAEIIISDSEEPECGK